MSRFLSLIVLPLAVAGCASRPVAVVQAPPPSPPAPVAPPMPAGGVPGMKIPARLPQGGYPTPSHGIRDGAPLSVDGAAWHLRSALNVAALACRDDALVTAYNAMIAARRTELAAVETRYAAEWKASGIGDWRDGYDDAMTRVYNFYGQSFGRPAFCAVAAETLADLAAQPGAALPTVAVDRLAGLDRPFTAFFAAYDAWRAGQAPVQMAAAQPETAAAPVIALAAAVPVARPVAPVTVAPAPPPPPAPTPAKPVLAVDPAVFEMQ